MELIVCYTWTLLVGCLGGLIGMRLRLPAGALVGSMFAVALANGIIDGPPATFPPECRFGLQVGLGILLGSRLKANILSSAKDLWRPVLLCTGMTLGMGIVSALIISHWLGIETLTAFLGSAPGGISDLSLIALDVGAQGTTVVIMHLVRLVSVIVIIPLVARWAVGMDRLPTARLSKPTQSSLSRHESMGNP